MKSMYIYKNKIYKGIILFFFILMFLFPYASYKGASSGLMLWFLNILPTLLPFIIISNLIIRLNIASKISRLIYPIIGKLFRVSQNGCYPILVGFLSGLPMGAKVVADLKTENGITEKEAEFLLSMCNNASPIFIMTYIATNQLKMPSVRLPLFIIIYSSSIISANIYRTYERNRDKRLNISKYPLADETVKAQSSYQSKKFTFSILDDSIMNGFEVITRIGGYIILFSILAEIINAIGPSVSLYKACAMGFLEITTGIDQICKIRIDSNIKIVLISIVTAFGGLSGLAQTKSVLGESRLSIRSYFSVKLLSTCVAMLLSILYVLFFRI
ncbi:MAG: transporter [Clostridiales bacterium]|mgnify:FL=1|nr:transporter [Clostridiales bacterium]